MTNPFKPLNPPMIFVFRLKKHKFCLNSKGSGDLKKTVIALITASPVNLFLKMSHFQTVEAPPVPLIYVEPFRPGLKSVQMV